MQKCDFNFLEITLLHGYSSVNTYYISAAERLLLENISGELLLYIVLNIDIINVDVLSRQVKKSCLKYI